MSDPMILWYRQSATCLNEALPIGNGKMAAFVYGGQREEKIQLDDATFWSGEPSRHNNRRDTPGLLKQIRDLLLKHRYREADQLGKEFIGVKNNYGTHMPLGELRLIQEDIAETAALKRTLDLNTGVAAASFTAGESNWLRECFLSYPAKVFALRYDSAEKSLFSLNVCWEGVENDVSVHGMQGQDILLSGHAHETLHSDGNTGVSLRGRIRIQTDGEVTAQKKGALISGATELVLLVSLMTTMTAEDPDILCRRHLDAAQKTGYENLRREHIADVREQMERVGFSLQEDVCEFPTDERIRRFAGGKHDSGLMVLAFQYGRYVTLASSREHSPLPTHMGGIWNDNIYNKQDSTQDMHIDMNLQMQYWPAFPCGLAECFAPVTRWLKEVLVPSGRETARTAYGIGGWVAHVTSNPWGYTALGWAYNWGSFTFGGAWCATLLWDYFEYTWDLEYLREQAWPVLLECAEFMLDYLFYEQDSGYFMTGPSYSPENHYLVDGEQFTLSLSTTCDILLIREIFTLVLRSARLLNLPENEMFTRISRCLLDLPPYQVGKHGQIQEWFYDFEEPIPNHRHPSHLLGLYPFSQITPQDTPVLAKAADISIGRRLTGFEKTSWGYNMFAGMYARLYDGNAAKAMLEENIRKLAVANLTIVMPADVAMWAGTWELDGNTGLSAAICEMVAQSREVADTDGKFYQVRLLPALPDDWPVGEFTGLCLRGGMKLSICWKDGRLLKAALLPVRDLHLTILWGEETLDCVAKANEEILIPLSCKP